MDKGPIKRTYGIWRRQRVHTGKDTALFIMRHPAKIFPDQMKIWPEYFVLMSLCSVCSHKVTEDAGMGRGFKKKKKKKRRRTENVIAAARKDKQTGRGGRTAPVRLVCQKLTPQSSFTAHSTTAAVSLCHMGQEGLQFMSY